MLRLLNFSFNDNIHCFFLLQTSKSTIHRFCLPMSFRFTKHNGQTCHLNVYMIDTEKYQPARQKYEVCDSFASLTRHQTSYSGSTGWCFRYQSIHIQITYTKHIFPEIHEVNLRTLTERHVQTLRKQSINLLYQPAWTILVKLCEINVFNSSQNDHSKYFGTNQLFPLLKYMINIS
jgi:hypothetical protein